MTFILTPLCETKNEPAIYPIYPSPRLF
jgi:hypothetical protein